MTSLERMQVTENNFKNLFKERLFVSNDTNFHDANLIIIGSSAGMGKSLIMRMIQDFYNAIGFETHYYNNASFEKFAKYAERDIVKNPESKKIFFADDCDTALSRNGNSSEKYRTVLQKLRHSPSVHKTFLSISMYSSIQEIGDLVETQRFRGSNAPLYSSDICYVLKRNMENPTILMDHIKHRFVEHDTFRIVNFFETLINEYENLGYNVSSARRLWKLDYSNMCSNSFKEIFSL